MTPGDVFIVVFIMMMTFLTGFSCGRKDGGK